MRTEVWFCNESGVLKGQKVYFLKDLLKDGGVFFKDKDVPFMDSGVLF